MRRALIVGIDDYPDAPLYGCVNDATRMAEILAKNQDGKPNFIKPKILVTPEENIDRALLLDSIVQLLAEPADMALFYFAGHGSVDHLGGYLVTQGSQRYHDGVAMAEVLALANQTKVNEVVILLDCCHSGAFGEIPSIQNDLVFLKEGVSVLTASRSSQSATEKDGGGVFTELVYEALDGGAADLLGNVSVASLYAYVDHSLGAWDQRPLFKSHVARLTPLRQCNPAVDLSILRLLPSYFKDPRGDYKLDPSFDPDTEPLDAENKKIFGHLQKLRAVGLVIPIGAEHMYHAAMQNKSCRLTPLGRFYWKLAKEGKI